MQKRNFNWLLLLVLTYLCCATSSIAKPATTFLPDQIIKLKLANIKYHSENLTSHLGQPVPVAVKVIVDPPSWTQTIKICNTTSREIPLTNIEFNFNYSGNITSIWGAPWVDWKVASHQGSQYTIIGGTQWSQALKPDPNCVTPLTIQFNSTPTTAAPTGPFVFKAEGAEPSGGGSLNINLPTAPSVMAPNPDVTVQGSSFNQQKNVAWEQSWKLDNLAAGNYTVTAGQVYNGQVFYEATPKNVSVQNNQTTQVNISYTAVPSTTVAVMLNSPPGAVSVSFNGAKYSATKTFTANDTINLPADTYNVTASTAGYTSKVAPNPLKVPTNTQISISFQKNSTIARFGAYFQTWSSKWSNDPATSDLARLPSYVNYVYLAFAKPDAAYVKGSMNYQTTGLEFNYQDGLFLKQAIAALHKAQPNTKVLLAIGGATFNNWDGLNAQAIADFVSDFGLDGVDVDYEAASPGCSKASDGLIHCQIDAKYQNIIQTLRRVLPRPYLISATAWSISAFGQDQWANAQPQGDYTGMMLPFLRSAAAQSIDYVNVMSYDASNAYDPKQALAAFNNYYKGPVYMGVEVPPEAWGGHVYTIAEVNGLTQATVAAAMQKQTTPGMMMWSLQKMPNGAPSSSNPDAQMMATAICNGLGLSNCNDKLFP